MSSTGYGYHGDVIIAWEGNTLEKAVATCTNMSGHLSDCPVFTLIDKGHQASCALESPLPSAIAHENVKDPINGFVAGMGKYSSLGPVPRNRFSAPASAPMADESQSVQPAVKAVLNQPEKTTHQSRIPQSASPPPPFLRYRHRVKRMIISDLDLLRE